MPSYPICSVNVMTCERFEFLWRNFHCNHATSDGFEENDQSELDDDEELMELQTDRVQYDLDLNVSKGDEILADDENEEESLTTK